MTRRDVPRRRTPEAGPGRPARLALRLLPRAFRDRHGAEMAQIWRLEWRAHRSMRGRIAWVVTEAVDLLRTASHERLFGSAPRPTPNRSPEGDALMTGLTLETLRAGRRLLRTPGFTLLASGTLALGIGASIAIFSVVHGVLLQPLPYPEPNRLVSIFHAPMDEPLEQDAVSFGNFADWRDQTKSFEAMAATFTQSSLLSDPGDSRRVRITGSVGSPFDVLQVQPIAGRVFHGAEDRPDAPAIAVLSVTLARDLFGSANAAVDQSVELSGVPRTVVGVVPDPIEAGADPAHVWLPSRFSEEMRQDRTEYWLRVIARLRPEVASAAAQAELDTVMAVLRREYPQANENVTATMLPMRDTIVGDVSQRLVLLQVAVGLLLLIACANVANLLLARGDQRRGEIAVRRALGASRRRVIGELFLESGWLALAGGAGGLVLAVSIQRLLPMLLPADLPRLHEIQLSMPVAVFAIALAAASSLVFGVLPALFTTRRRRSDELRRGRAGGSVMGSGVVIAEVALATVLLIGAGLLLRSFDELRSVDPGFRPANLLTFNLPAPPIDGDNRGARRFAYFQAVTESLEALPGVREVGLISNLPGSGRGTGAWINFQDRILPENETPPVAVYRVASADYFTAAGIPLRAGRYTNDRDGADGTPSVLINESAARRFWPEESPVGKVITLGPDGGWIPPSTVVGVVGDVQHQGLGTENLPVVYMPHALAQIWDEMGVVLRTDGPPEAVIPDVRRAVAALHDRAAALDFAPAEAVLARSVAPTLALGRLLGLFAATALVLAAGGIFATFSYAVARRHREIGIRLAVGAAARGVFAMVVVEAMIRIVVGVAMGLGLAVVFGRNLRSLLFDVAPHDPATLLLGAMGLIAVSLLAVSLPARKASSLQPAPILRGD